MVVNNRISVMFYPMKTITWNSLRTCRSETHQLITSLLTGISLPYCRNNVGSMRFHFHALARGLGSYSTTSSLSFPAELCRGNVGLQHCQPRVTNLSRQPR
ncbi:hypothetical protein KC19_7G117100 [Ceratodon purpureus]|uniref:Uncharacterized protein n=1 Tax=Ceratodon purpureus TaxID=3225 RepID=A0A8T0HA04_CERPU|nr:hypothetical protein KC19_N043600 [Ceratodon purpureus]KAG0504336.1 hypothetical protein KC19_N041100 [Ceratodon purpureus]KAG0555110.1 hypothetical protein KC19_12G145000 [Ceratodon purpureus]KAG0567184.1 hypothetical protein KC19_7G117100 [Ceratodon purpureus]